MPSRLTSCTAQKNDQLPEMKTGGAQWTNASASIQPNSPRRRNDLSFRFARYPVLSLAGFLTLGALRISAAPADTIYLESNSTAGNSIFTYTFNFTSAPGVKSTTPAGGVGVFDPTFALGTL